MNLEHGTLPCPSGECSQSVYVLPWMITCCNQGTTSDHEMDELLANSDTEASQKPKISLLNLRNMSLESTCQDCLCIQEFLQLCSTTWEIHISLRGNASNFLLTWKIIQRLWVKKWWLHHPRTFRSRRQGTFYEIDKNNLGTHQRLRCPVRTKYPQRPTSSSSSIDEGAHRQI